MNHPLLFNNYNKMKYNIIYKLTLILSLLGILFLFIPAVECATLNISVIDANSAPISGIVFQIFPGIPDIDDNVFPIVLNPPASDGKDNDGDGLIDESGEDFNGYATSADGKAQIDLPEGDYTLVGFSQEKHILLFSQAKSPGSITLNMGNTVPVNISCRAMDGSPISNSEIFFRPTKRARASVGYTDNKGQLKAYVSEGMYNIVLWSASGEGPHYLILLNYKISKLTANVSLHVSELPIAQLRFDLPQSTAIALFEVLESSNTIEYAEGVEPEVGYDAAYTDFYPFISTTYPYTLSANINYNFSMSFVLVFNEGIIYAYEIRPSLHKVTPGTHRIGITEKDVFKPHISSNHGEKNVYNPGEKVQLYYQFIDGRGNMLNRILNFTGARLIFPIITIRDPNGIPITNNYSTIDFSSFEFALPKSAITGEYKAEISLDAGIYGKIEDVFRFYVQSVVDNIPPVIDLVSLPDQAESGVELKATAKITDNSGSIIASPIIRISNDNINWKDIPMSLSGSDIYQATIAPNLVTYGDLNWQISAQDTSGNKGIKSGIVKIIDTTEPIINHNLILKAELGTRLKIEADVSDNSSVKEVTLFYSIIDGITKSVRMSTSGKAYFAFIDGTEITYNGLNYYISAVDIAGNIAFFSEDNLPKFANVIVEDTTPPFISHDPVKIAIANTPLRIEAIIIDNSGFVEATLFYKKNLDAQIIIKMALINGMFMAEIPSSDVIIGSLKYYIKAYDAPDPLGKIRSIINPSDGDYIVEVVTAPQEKLASIEIMPFSSQDSPLKIKVGESLKFSVIGRSESNKAVPVNVLWLTTDGTGHINQDGFFMPYGHIIGNGKGKIIAIAINNDKPIIAESYIQLTPSDPAIITLNPSSVVLSAGDQHSFFADVTDIYFNRLNTEVKWHSDIGTIYSSSGTQSVLRFNKTGTGKLIAEYNELTAESDINVIPGKLKKIVIGANAEAIASALHTTEISYVIKAGSDLQFTATGYDANDNPIPITPIWSIRGNIGTIRSDGVFIGGTSGNGKIVAMLGDVSETLDVEVIPGELYSVSVMPYTAYLPVSTDSYQSTYQFNAIGRDVAGNVVPLKSISWRTDALAGEISASGFFVAITDPGVRISEIVINGTVFATGVSLSGYRVESAGYVVIQKSPANRLSSVNVIVQATSGGIQKINLATGNSIQLEAVGKDSDGKSISISPLWSVSGGIGNIDVNGLFTAVRPGVGTAIATSGGFTGQIEISVTTGIVKSIEIKPEMAFLNPGTKASFTAIGYDSFENVVPIDLVQWSVDDNSLIMETKGNSCVIEINPQSKGLKTISRISAKTGDLMAFSNVLMRISSAEIAQPPKLANAIPYFLEINPDNISVISGTKYQFTAKAVDILGHEISVGNLAWSGTSEIGEIDGTGLFSANNQQNSPGRVVVTDGKVYASAIVNVLSSNPKIDSMIIYPSKVDISSGSVQKFLALVQVNNAYIPPIDAISWKAIGNNGSVDRSGTFKATVVGKGGVMASVAGLSATSDINTMMGEIANIEIQPSTISTKSGKQQKLKLTATDNINVENLPFDQSKYPIQISGKLGAIDQSGLFIAQEFGTGYMMVSDFSKAEVIVSTGDITELSIYPDNQRVVSGSFVRFSSVGKDAIGNLIAVNPVWALSGSANIGTISTDGLFIADKIGNEKIIAKIGELSTYVNIEVIPGIPAFILVEPSLVSISSQSAEKRVFSAIFKDLRGNTVIDTAGVKLTWSVIGDIGAIEPSTGVFVNKTGIYESRTGYVNVTAIFNQGTAKENKLLGRCAVVLQPTPKPLASITITPNSVSVIKADSQKFNAIGKNIDGLEMELRPQWRVISSDGKEIGGAISADGIFLATTETSVGSSYKIQASAINSEGKNIIGEAVANIIAGSLQSIEITCTEDCTKPFESGKTLELTAIGYDKFINVVDISPNWKVVGQIGTINPQSKNKAIWTAGLVGSGEVVAESSGKEGKVHLTVIHGKLDHISISTFPQSDLFIGSNESNPLITKSGSSITFKATGFDSDKDELGRSKSVNSFSISSEWSVKSSNLGSISADGKFVGKEVGSGYIESKSGNISALFYIKVISGSLFSIKISPSTISLVSGKDLEYKFVPTGYDQQGNQVLIKPVWKTVGGIGTIDENGLLKTAVLPSGINSISGAVVVSQGAIEGSSTVKIVSAIGELSRIVLTIEPSTIQAGSKATCSVKGFDEFGNPITKLPSSANLSVSEKLGSLTPSDTQDIWIFRAVEQLPIERNGKITASIDANGKILIAEATLSLVPAPLDKIVVDPSALSASAGEEQRFKAYGNDTYGNTIDLLATEWGVLGGIGKVTLVPELSQECVFLATTKGEGQLVISSQNHEGKADIQVVHGQIVTLDIEPVLLTIESGKTHKFTTIAKDGYGNIANDLKIQWQVSDANIGSITDDGVFSAKKAGSSIITALYDSISIKAEIIVTFGEIASAEILIESEGSFLNKPYNLISGSMYLLYLRGLDSYENEILQLDEVAWKISDGMGLINSDAGKFILTALFPSSGDISANVGKISINSDINIIPYTQNVISTNGALIKGAFDAQIEIPPNSFRKDETTSISLSPTVGLIQSAKRIGYVYKLEPEGMILSIPAKLTLSYKYTMTSDIDESLLSIYFWDKFQQKWLRTGGNVDSKQKTVTANINYLSLFAIMQESEQIFTSENRIEVKLSPNTYFAPEINRLTIRYNIGWKSYELVNITVNIYDIKGNLVRELVDKIPKYPGWNAEQWDGTDESGKVVKNGRYFVVITGESNGEKISKTSHLVVFK
jgi:hypothetical protein